jgi:hypothetical protein
MNKLLGLGKRADAASAPAVVPSTTYTGDDGEHGNVTLCTGMHAWWEELAGSSRQPLALRKLLSVHLSQLVRLLHTRYGPRIGQGT